VDPLENCGTLKFNIDCKSPDATKIPRAELLCTHSVIPGVTALLLTASYRNQEFIRVGYYVHNQLVSEGVGEPTEELPLNQLLQRVKRTIISDKPRVTKFNIDWSDAAKKSIGSSEDSQSKLEDFFSVSGKSKNDEQDSTSNKPPLGNELMI
jgi:histone chaperone ASF1